MQPRAVAQLEGANDAVHRNCLELLKCAAPRVVGLLLLQHPDKLEQPPEMLRARLGLFLDLRMPPNKARVEGLGG